MGIDKLQVVTFLGALAALCFVTAGAIALGLDGLSVGIGFACGWLIGLFHAVNALIMDKRL